MPKTQIIPNNFLANLFVMNSWINNRLNSWLMIQINLLDRTLWLYAQSFSFSSTLNGSLMPFLLLVFLYLSNRCGEVFSSALLLHFASENFLSFLCPFSANNRPKRQLNLFSALQFGEFGTVAKALMKAMIDPSNSYFDFDDTDSDSPSPPHSKSTITEATIPPTPKSSFNAKLINLKKNHAKYL